MPTASSVPSRTDAYLSRASAGDRFEIAASRIAVERTASPRIRAFAQRMIDEHTTTSESLQAAAKEARLLPVPPALNLDQQRLLRQLSSMPAAGFDIGYLSGQRSAHQQALTLHQGYAAHGEVPSLKATAAKISAVVQHHLDELDALPQH
ncbi:DUF4142 domain-containing protein [Flavisphingomonas formosensis]|uniref:DUF4142 domain-containing protein n=1 Tax=Flavisphingomonas formosensis TaxID=861534 RepID=UPI0012FAF23C|nr:DUF4142 domain-containing protein [Sphingomonas formosensis]